MLVNKIAMGIIFCLLLVGCQDNKEKILAANETVIKSKQVIVDGSLQKKIQEYASTKLKLLDISRGK